MKAAQVIQIILLALFSIMCYAIDAIDPDGNNDLLMGFTRKGKQYNQIIALNAHNSGLNKKWHYIKDLYHLYPGEQNGIFKVLG